MHELKYIYAFVAISIVFIHQPRLRTAGIHRLYNTAFTTFSMILGLPSV